MANAGPPTRIVPHEPERDRDAAACLLQWMQLSVSREEVSSSFFSEPREPVPRSRRRSTPFVLRASDLDAKR